MMTQEQVNEMMAQLAALQQENESLKAKQARKAGKLVIKLSSKGGASVYGLGRFPTTLYAEQWKRLIAFVPEIQAFLEANADKLSVKPAAEAKTEAA